MIIHYKDLAGIWQAEEIKLRNLPVIANEVGSNVSSSHNFRTSKDRNYGLYYESSTSSIQLFLEEIRYYHGSGSTIGDGDYELAPVTLPARPS